MTARWSRVRRICPGMFAPMLVATIWAGSVATAEEAPLLSQLLETVRITVPPVVAFDVADVGASTEGINGATSVAFDTALVGLGRAVRISVKADSDINPPGGPSIPASNVSWSTSSVIGGVGVNGVLSKTTYTQVFQSNVGALSGSVDLVWNLSPPGPAVRAGTHQVTLRWKIESVIP